MSLIPAFELGIWNAWIITVVYTIITTIPGQINKEVVKKRMGLAKWSEISKTDKKVGIITHGIGIGCLSWVFVLCAATLIISYHIMIVKSGESSAIDKYGDAYREYMDRTRWIGIPKSRKKE